MEWELHESVGNISKYQTKTLTCNSRFAVAEQVCAWHAPPAPVPPAALPEWEFTCGGSIQCSHTLLCTAICVHWERAKRYRSFIFMSKRWISPFGIECSGRDRPSLRSRSSRPTGVRRHWRRRRHRFDYVRRVEGVSVYANEAPRRGRRCEAARRGHYPARKKERHCCVLHHLVGT